jgi:hypothetical protein
MSILWYKTNSVYGIKVSLSASHEGNIIILYNSKVRKLYFKSNEVHVQITQKQVCMDRKVMQKHFKYYILINKLTLPVEILIFIRLVSYEVYM